MGHLAAFVYAAGSIVCHQIPERSFHIAGIQFPVCARCTGLYTGALAGVLIWVLCRTRHMSRGVARRALVLAAVPTLLTATTAWIGWWDPGNALRATLAVPLGIALGAVVTAALARDLR